MIGGKYEIQYLSRAYYLVAERQLIVVSVHLSANNSVYSNVLLRRWWDQVIMANDVYDRVEGRIR